MTECGEPCEVFSRVVGYFRPVARWNDGKAEEFRDRKMFDTSALFESQKQQTPQAQKIQEAVPQKVRAC